MGKKTAILLITIAVVCLLLSVTSIFISLRSAVPLKYNDAVNERIKKIEQELKLTQEDIKKYEYLLDNFNDILTKTVYYGTAYDENSEPEHSFTAFSLFYKDKFYLITAGHSVEFEGLRFENFKFKSNYRDIWLTPELLYYISDFKNNNDFAIFQDDLVLNGLYPAESDMRPEFVIGNTERNLNILKKYNEEGFFAVYGESGSPVLNDQCRVVGVLINNKGEYTEIFKVLNVLDEITEG